MDLSRFPRRRYTQHPTPIEHLPHFSEALGGPQIWIKRDDQLGLTPGGNKTRKLEFLVADALAHMNDKGYVHADMKPTNVLVTEDGSVKVIDLGQAHPIGKAKERIQGTPGFMAPEQAEIQPLSERTDVYNFGATIYWMLTSQEVPTAGPGSRGGKAAVPPPANRFNPDVPVELAEVVNLCLEPNEHGRWKNMHAVTRQLDKVLASMPMRSRTA